MDYPVAGRDDLLAGQGGEETYAVLAASLGQLGAHDIRHGGEEIRQANQLVGLAPRLHLAGPLDDERDTVPAVPKVGLGTTQVGAHLVPLLGQIPDAGRLGTTIVTGTN